MSRRQKPDPFTVVRDMMGLLGGWALIAREASVPASQFNLWLLVLGGTLVGVPGFGQLWAIRTAGSLSPPPVPDSERPSSSSSSTPDGDR